MKLKINVLFVACIATLTCFSQAISLRWGKEIESSRFSIAKGFIGRTETDLFMLQDNRTGLFSKPKLALTKFRLEDLNLQKSIALMAKSAGHEYENLIMCKDKIYLFSSKYDKDSKTNTAYAQELNDAGGFVGGLIKLDNIKTDSKNNRGHFEIILSNDSSKILVVNNPPYFKYAGEKFGFKVYDKDLKVISNKEVQLPYKDKKFSARDYELGDDGTVYLLAKIDLERKEKEKDQAEYYYEIVSVTPTGEVKEYELKINDKRITDIAFRQDKKGKNLLCAGFCANMKGRAQNEITGTFFLRINTETKEIEAQSTKDFDKDFIEELTSKRKADRGRGISTDFDLSHFVRKEDGGVVAVAEYRYDYVVTTRTKDGTRTDYHYVRNNIIAFNIDPDGKILWNLNIPKFQHTVNDGSLYNSFMVKEVNNTLYFVYNDHKKNIQIKNPKKFRVMRRPKASMTTLVIVDNDGKFEKMNLQNNRDSKFVVVPWMYNNISGNEVLLYAYKPIPFSCCFINIGKAKYKIGKLSF